MNAPTHLAPQALGAEAQDDPRACLFCGELLANRGSAFMDHLKDSAECSSSYEAWLERLNEDRPGG